MKRKFHVQFCSGGRAGDCPADHNQPDCPYAPCFEKSFVCVAVWLAGVLRYSRAAGYACRWAETSKELLYESTLD